MWKPPPVLPSWHSASRRRYENLTTGEQMAERLTASCGSSALVLVDNSVP